MSRKAARVYELATQDDDACLRTLLMENPMQGWVRLCLTHEPSFFAGMPPFGRARAVLAREDGDVLGMFSCSEQNLYLNGVPRETGYLGGLRVRKAHRHRIRILREGFAALLRFSMPTARLWHTSIASGNHAARRLLEAHLSGLPHYQPANELLTLALPTVRGKRHGSWQAAGPEDHAALCALYNEAARQWQFAPVLRPEDLEAFERAEARFYLCREAGCPVAVMALWPRRGQQTLVQGYRWPLDWLRAPYNLFAACSKQLRLPAPGQNLQHAYLAFFAVSPGARAEFGALVEDALHLAGAQGHAALSLSLHAAHPALPELIRRFRPVQYRTCLYAVSFPHLPHPEPDGRPAQPEAALMA